MKVIKNALVFIAIAVMGIIMLIAVIKDKVELSKPPANLATMTEADFYAGRYVEGTIYELWNNYAELQQSDTTFGIKHNTKTVGQYFAMPLETSFETGIPKFVSLSVSEQSDILTAGKMEKESLDYYNDKIDELTTTMHIKGRVTKMSKEAREIFDKYMSDEGFTPSTVSVYYVINVNHNTSKSVTAELIIAIVISLVGVAGALITILRGIHRGF